MRCESNNYHTMDGLDATGKSTLANLIHKQTGAVILCSPPYWMKPYRELFEKTGVESRFIFYSFGNFWVDHFVLQPLLKHNPDDIQFLQDRSWITTLTAHQLRGVSDRWLSAGLWLAKKSVVPRTAYILYVDPDVRRKRLFERNVMTISDRRNLYTDEKMNAQYVYWAHQLELNVNVFNNTRFTPEEACREMLRQFAARD